MGMTSDTGVKPKAVDHTVLDGMVTMRTTQVILVGGFLGAGKTTLLAQASSRLVQRGKRIGLITNDQAPGLVDTAILRESQAAVEEVSGGCFCCHFGDFVTAMDRLMQSGTPDIILGEPVGSCTDLSATVLQPLKKFHPNRFHLAPFSVLVDAKQVQTLNRLRKSLQSAVLARFPENVMYIYEKQLEEADIIVLNKADLLSSDELANVQASLRQNFPQATVISISALNGDGVDAWLDYVMATSVAGRTITTVDYDEYAEGEAALGWLNATIRINGDSTTNWKTFCAAFMVEMQRQFKNSSAEIAHLKLHLAAGNTSLVANLTGNEVEPYFRGTSEGSYPEAIMLVNIRAATEPLQLRALTEQCVGRVAGATIRLAIEDLRCFAPSRPQPTHRFADVV